jgi:hypothetical protein
MPGYCHKLCPDVQVHILSIYYSLINLLCDTAYSELLPELLNKLYIKSEFVPVHDMKVYWGTEVWLQLFLTLVLGGSR